MYVDTFVCVCMCVLCRYECCGVCVYVCVCVWGGGVHVHKSERENELITTDHTISEGYPLLVLVNVIPHFVFIAANETYLNPYFNLSTVKWRQAATEDVCIHTVN